MSKEVSLWLTFTNTRSHQATTVSSNLSPLPGLPPASAWCREEGSQKKTMSKTNMKRGPGGRVEGLVGGRMGGRAERQVVERGGGGQKGGCKGGSVEGRTF